MENLLFLGVPILKHIRVCLLSKARFPWHSIHVLSSMSLRLYCNTLGYVGAFLIGPQNLNNVQDHFNNKGKNPESPHLNNINSYFLRYTLQYQMSI